MDRRMKANIESLTPRELQIMKLIAMGVDRHDIAGQVGCDIKTYDSHRQAIIGKLGLRGHGTNLVALIARYAIAAEIVESPLELIGNPVILDATGVPT